LRLNSSLDDAFVHINDQLCDDLPDDRFVTGFFGLLDANTHIIRFHSGGQGPIMHYHAMSGDYDWHPATTFPLGYMPQVNLGEALELQLAPGDVLGVISDGIYEYENESGVQFGQAGVAAVIDRMPDATADELVTEIMRAAREHGGSAPQADDITIVLARRSRE
jgi:serine phosphatase RsbU (regulator of sigma subunit)